MVEVKMKEVGESPMSMVAVYGRGAWDVKQRSGTRMKVLFVGR